MKTRIRSLKRIGFRKYAVSEDGCVWSVSRKKKMAPNTDRRGYWRVAIVDDNREHKTIRIHRLVASAFVPNPKNKKYVNHIDGDKNNNRANNLEWCTLLENTKHARETGLMPHNVFSEEDVHLICRRLVQGLRVAEICRTYNYPKHATWAIAAKRNWLHISDGYNLPPIKSFKRLSKKEVSEVTSLLTRDNCNCSEIATKYGVTPSAMQRMRKRLLWEGVKKVFNE